MLLGKLNRINKSQTLSQQNSLTWISNTSIFRRVAGSLRLSFHCRRFHGFLEQTANSPDKRETLIGYLMIFSLIQQKMCVVPICLKKSIQWPFFSK